MPHNIRIPIKIQEVYSRRPSFMYPPPPTPYMIDRAETNIYPHDLKLGALDRSREEERGRKETGGGGGVEVLGGREEGKGRRGEGGGRREEEGEGRREEGGG